MIRHSDSYDNISIKDIAQRAEIPAGSVYSYYPRKEDILLDAFSLLSLMYVSGLKDAVASVNAPDSQSSSVKDRIMKFCRYYAWVSLERDGVTNSHPFFFFYTHAYYNDALYQLLIKNRELCLGVVQEALRPLAKSEQALFEFTQAYRSLNIGLVEEIRIGLPVEQAYPIFDAFLESMIPRCFRIS